VNYHIYKITALEGCIRGTHGNTRAIQLGLQTIQACATLTTIISKNFDKMPKEFRIIGHKQVDNFKVVPSTMNWDHMRDEVYYVRTAYLFLLDVTWCL